MKSHTAAPAHSSLPAVTSYSRLQIPDWDDFRSVVEGSEDLLTVIDSAGRILYDNPAVEAVLGYRQGELVGRSAFELIHPDDYATAVALLAELATGARTAAALAFRFRRRGGGWCRLESSGRVVATSPGAPRIVVTSHARADTGGAYARNVETGRDRSRGELEEARVEVVERLARAAEFRDDDTGQHLRRVGGLSASLADHLGLAPRDVEVVRRAAPLHDVGKIGIPDAVLLKPGPLLPEEEEVMRTHPVLGARILAGGATALIRAAEEIALSHHERWDGLGYPRGLSGDRIPLYARVVSIVDFFDALTHDRPYRRAWDRPRVLDLIRSESRARFDPQVAAAFLALIESLPQPT
jgi:putative two-component system response regulator